MTGRIVLSICLCTLLVTGSLLDQSEVELRRDDDSGRLHVSIDGRVILVYQYKSTIDIPHYFPMNSPSGKNMLVEQAEPYPHHRAFWFADTVRLSGGREVSTYNALYTGQMTGRNTYGPPFRDHIRHLRFNRCEAEGSRAVIETDLLWEMDNIKPVLEEHRHLVVQALDKGEYLLDITFVLTAAFGDVEFTSDDVHYAWPYLRLHPTFSGTNGGIITADNGAAGQEATNMRIARWIDYSNTVEGVSEGVAVFQWPDGQDHRWLTREYGCFGPRRPDDRSGHPFTLKKGESVRQRVGIFVHRGNVKAGRVSKRYKQYIRGKWQR
jgi:hypothetical protein